ncbi:MAG: M64 family metallopeptidase [Jejuia sp.]
MKHYLLLLVSLFFYQTFFSQVFDVETIKSSGDNDKRINLVILSEGYQESELDTFKSDAESLVTDMFAQSPFAEYSDFFNVHIIKVPSNESGADHPGTATDVTEPLNIPVINVDTYFNATFDAFGFHRFLYYGIDYADAASAEAKIISVLADNFPTYDQALLLVNTSEYGGTGGQFPISSTTSNEISIHELGHSMFNLKDEYLLPDVFYGEAKNMTQNSDPSTIKWKNWLNDNGIGIYPYGNSGVPATWYKPRQVACKMEALNNPFCAVCKEGMIEKIHELLSVIDSYTPDNSSSIDNPTFPVEFTLTLIQPNPNTLEPIWTLNGNNFGNNVDTVSVLETDLVEGSNTLTAVITDESPMLRLDTNNTVHVHTLTWMISYSTLGIRDIEASKNNYTISLYPNPTNALVNLKVGTKSVASLKVEITSLDGKRLKLQQFSSNAKETIDVSNLSSGIYVANVYDNNLLLTSRKLVKQ